jgi:ABC-type phosphate transport system substrate-binding protein
MSFAAPPWPFAGNGLAGPVAPLLKHAPVPVGRSAAPFVSHGREFDGCEWLTAVHPPVVRRAGAVHPPLLGMHSARSALLGGHDKEGIPLLRTKWKIAAAASTMGLLAGFVSAGPASAASLQPPPTGIKKTTLTIVGSNTTQSVMGAISAAYGADLASNPDKVKMNNVFAVLGAGVSQTAKAQPAGEGATCGSFTYGPDTTNPPPNGSSAGITALLSNVFPATVAGVPTTANNDTAGCIGLTRSSRGRTGSDPASIHFWAYAKDAVDVVRFKIPAPVSTKDLTQTQIQNIYKCSSVTHMPTTTDWHDLNPAAPVGSFIIRYLPQAGSGSLSFFETKILGIASGHADDNCSVANGAGQIVAKRIEENEADEICQGPGTVPVPPPLPNPCSSSAEDDRNVAISIFGVGDYTSEKAGLITNRTAKTKLDTVGGVAPTIGLGGNIDNGSFLGWRYIYNVLDDNEPATLASQALRFAGNTAAGPGYICSGATSSTLTQYGMTPLVFGPDPNHSELANSNCKLEPNPNVP